MTSKDKVKVDEKDETYFARVDLRNITLIEIIPKSEIKHEDKKTYNYYEIFTGEQESIYTGPLFVIQSVNNIYDVSVSFNEAIEILHLLAYQPESKFTILKMRKHAVVDSKVSSEFTTECETIPTPTISLLTKNQEVIDWPNQVNNLSKKEQDMKQVNSLLHKHYPRHKFMIQFFLASL